MIAYIIEGQGFNKNVDQMKCNLGAVALCASQSKRRTILNVKTIRWQWETSPVSFAKHHDSLEITKERNACRDMIANFPKEHSI